MVKITCFSFKCLLSSLLVFILDFRKLDIWACFSPRCTVNYSMRPFSIQYQGALPLIMSLKEIERPFFGLTRSSCCANWKQTEKSGRSYGQP